MMDENDIALKCQTFAGMVGPLNVATLSGGLTNKLWLVSSNQENASIHGTPSAGGDSYSDNMSTTANTPPTANTNSCKGCAVSSRCSSRRSSSQESPQKVIFRLYGSNVESLYDPSLELSLFQQLSYIGLAPKLYHCFESGRIEQFLEGRTLQCDEMHHPTVVSKLAATLRRLHDVPIEGELATLFGMPRRIQKASSVSKIPNCLENIIKWADICYFLLFKKAQNAKLALPLDQLEPLVDGMNAAFDRSKVCTSLENGPEGVGLRAILEDLEWLQHEIESFDTVADSDVRTLVLSHNDLLQGNIILQPALETDEQGTINEVIDDRLNIRLIDFEYSGLNFPAFDIANYFCESHIDYSVSPDDDQLDLGFKITGDGCDVDEKVIEHFVDNYISVSENDCDCDCTDSLQSVNLHIHEAQLNMQPSIPVPSICIEDICKLRYNPDNDESGSSEEASSHIDTIRTGRSGVMDLDELDLEVGLMEASKLLMGARITSSGTARNSSSFSSTDDLAFNLTTVEEKESRTISSDLTNGDSTKDSGLSASSCTGRFTDCQHRSVTGDWDRHPGMLICDGDGDDQPEAQCIDIDIDDISDDDRLSQCCCNPDRRNHPRRLIPKATFIEDVYLHMCAAHVMWGLWAIVRAPVAVQQVSGTDYLGFAAARFTQYWNCKEHYLRLKDTFSHMKMDGLNK